jgi:hypothetical protein
MRIWTVGLVFVRRLVGSYSFGFGFSNCVDVIEVPVNEVLGKGEQVDVHYLTSRTYYCSQESFYKGEGGSASDEVEAPTCHASRPFPT